MESPEEGQLRVRASRRRNKGNEFVGVLPMDNSLIYRLDRDVVDDPLANQPTSSKEDNLVLS